jgi:hypothetical protein
MIGLGYWGPGGGVRSKRGISPTTAGSRRQASQDEAPWESVEVEPIPQQRHRMPGFCSRSVNSRDPHPGIERKWNGASLLDRSLIIS